MRITILIGCILGGAVIGAQPPQTAPAQPPPSPTGYQDTPMQPNGKRPQPRVATPGPLVSLAPPSDAIVLLGSGQALSRWQMTQGGGQVSWPIGKYEPSHAKGYIGLQDHGNPVRFRNIWIRPLVEAQ